VREGRIGVQVAAIGPSLRRPLLIIHRPPKNGLLLQILKKVDLFSIGAGLGTESSTDADSLDPYN